MNKLKDMRKYEIDVLVPMFDKESQLGRSFGKKGRPSNFNRELFNLLQILRKKVDNNTIRNNTIRNSIKRLSKKTGASIGQSQKVINVYLKVYCFIKNKPNKIIKELDCPLDSTTMKGEKTMRGLGNFKEYEYFQKTFENRNNGIRILEDMKYDRKRLERYGTFNV